MGNTAVVLVISFSFFLEVGGCWLLSLPLMSPRAFSDVCGDWGGGQRGGGGGWGGLFWEAAFWALSCSKCRLGRTRCGARVLLLRAPALRRNSLQHENIMAGERSGLGTEAALGGEEWEGARGGKASAEQREMEGKKKKACGHGQADRRPLTAHYPLKALIIAKNTKGARKREPWV